MRHPDATTIGRRLPAAGLIALAAFAHVGCTPKPDPAPPGPPPAAFTPEVLGDRPGLHNVIRLTDRLLSGGGPDGEAGFRSLRDLGVRTVISVDGATPDVAAARAFGLRYVHLPVGYDGVPREAALRIARAVRDLPGPAYVHCHHGKHRGPAAAVSALRCLDGGCPAAAALAFLRTAGTDPKYAGLYAGVEGMAAATADDWERAGTDFPEVAAVPGLVSLMVGIDERWDRLKLVKAAGWAAPRDHPDLDPPHEAVQLAEHYREAARLEEGKGRGAEFVRMAGEGEAAAAELEQALRTKPADAGRAGRAFTRSAAACASCHDQFRDRPGGR
jgi:protein tyrosine phosphatase (PTP) superfamily phosphohydrolase (DUF442 family)